MGFQYACRFKKEILSVLLGQKEKKKKKKKEKKRGLYEKYCYAFGHGLSAAPGKNKQLYSYNKA